MTDRLFRHLLFCTCCVSAMGVASADDWPQWNGPNRDGTFSAANLDLSDQPNPVWTHEVGLGYSGPVIAADRVIISDYLLESGKVTNNAGKRDKLTGKERVTCLDRLTGERVWQYAYNRTYDVSYPAGPRATPLIHEGLVYVLGSEGDLTCLTIDAGKEVWQRSLNSDFGADTPLWGHAASPLVYENMLICMVGGSGSLVVAFDLATGEVVWKSLTSEQNETGYCPPVIVDAGGTDQLIVWSPTTLYGLNPLDGSVHWHESVQPDYGMSILPAISDGNLLFVSGEGSQSAMFRLADDKPAVELLWRGTPKDSVYLATSNAVFVDGHIYGADIRSGTLIGFEAETGMRLWRTAVPTTGSSRGRGAAHASAFLIRVGKEYLILSETGDLIQARLSPAGYQEISRFHAIEPTTQTMGRRVLWTYPAFDGEHVFIRNDKRLICYRVASP